MGKTGRTRKKHADRYRIAHRSTEGGYIEAYRPVVRTDTLVRALGVLYTDLETAVGATTLLAVRRIGVDSLRVGVLEKMGFVELSRRDRNLKSAAKVQRRIEQECTLADGYTDVRATDCHVWRGDRYTHASLTFADERLVEEQRYLYAALGLSPPEDPPQMETVLFPNRKNDALLQQIKDSLELHVSSFTVAVGGLFYGFEQGT